ncbi:MAG: VCBS repeat-containing protein [Chitinophagaceae bacterium]|nr:VCBS repeat-containing protein [Chitinophagaceae bacterium]
MKKIITLTALLLSGFSIASIAQTYQVKNNRCFADVNGDGMDDYIILSGDPANPTVNVRYSNGLTFDRVPNIVSRPNIYRKLVGASYFADINGDGRADFVTFQGNPQTPRIVAYLSTDEGFSNQYVVMSDHFDRGYDGFPRGFADINGDGRWDYITFRGDMARPYIVAYFSRGYKFDSKSYKSAALLEPAKDGVLKAFADINADGMADYMDSYDGDQINTYLGNKIEYPFQFLYPYKNSLSKPIPRGYEDMPRGYYDIDGDKRADYVTFRGNEEKPNIYIHYSFGQSFEDEPRIARQVERGLPGMPNGFADVNGDKKWDYIAFRGTEQNPKPVVYFSTGKDFLEPTDEMTISLINDAAYNAYFLIRYDLEGVEKSIHSPVVVTGQSMDYAIPEDAYNVQVEAFCNDCYDKRRVFTDFINRADNPGKVCYRVMGTQFKKSWDYGNCNKARK